jgi:hypothetical protein
MVKSEKLVDEYIENLLIYDDLKKWMIDTISRVILDQCQRVDTGC